MMAQCRIISHAGNMLNYVKKDEAQEISRKYLIGESPSEITREFQMVQNSNTRCKNNVFDFVVSPSPDDKLKFKDFEKITHDFLEKMGLNEQQHIAYLHRDSGKPHVHICVNRIDYHGQAVPDKFISNRASRTADKIAQEMKLIRAQDLRGDLKPEKKLKQEFEKAHEKAIKGNIRTFEDYQKAMKTQSYNVEKAVSKETGKISGLRVGKIGEKPIKISDVSRKVGTKLTKSFGAKLANLTPAGRVLSIARKTKSVTKTISRGMGI